ncbi:hypothetical protein CFE70_005190 [Pyrenophora teres f. teres 0-1]
MVDTSFEYQYFGDITRKVVYNFSARKDPERDWKNEARSWLDKISIFLPFIQKACDTSLKRKTMPGGRLPTMTAMRGQKKKIPTIPML